MIIEKDCLLADLTSLKMGGRAGLFVRADTVEDLIEALRMARGSEKEVMVLGGGSSVVISDEGFAEMVIQPAWEGVRVVNETEDAVEAEVGAGKSWDECVSEAVAKEWQGFECLSGIPGQTGAGLIQNIGAYGQEIGNTVKEVHCLNKETLQTEKLSNQACDFSYRDSVFKKRRELIITRVVFVLKKGTPPEIKYKSLQEAFKDKQPSLEEVRKKVIEIRASKSMVLDPEDPNTKSVGSFFINPIIGGEKLADLKEKTQDQMPYWEVTEDKFKIPAAWLIENSGFNKGYEYKNVGISSKHCLALINRGGGTSKELLELANIIQEGVLDKYGISLSIEPTLVGNF
jgi:UDP-N-acetylmuramate dehydrogenase